MTGAAHCARPPLTEAQQEVLRYLGRGPVKVEAAAGSGKTTTMAALFAAALDQGEPLDRVMAVTFTERAAGELKARVATALDVTGEAPNLERAWIGTFHALVRRLLREHSYRAGMPRRQELLDEYQASRLWREASLEVQERLGRDPGFIARVPESAAASTLRRLLPGALEAARRLRSTPHSPAEVRQLSEAAYRRWEAEGSHPAVELVWHHLALEMVRATWEAYEHLLRRRAAVDFDGVLRQGREALLPGRPLGEWARQHFRLVIVDEYQDTSAIQEDLVLSLTAPDHRSLFMVGDARQSIYAFRDAKPGVMADAPGRGLPLFENHRSRQSILDAAEMVIRQDAHFQADPLMRGTREGLSRLPVVVMAVASAQQEAVALADTLQALHDREVEFPDGSRKAFGWGDLAVLARTLSQLGRPLEEALRARGIPFQTPSGRLFERPEVKDALALLQLVLDEEDDLAALRSLQARAVRLPDRALLALPAGTGPGQHSLMGRVRHHLRDAAPGWTPEWRRSAEGLLEWLRSLRRTAAAAPASTVLQEALDLTGTLRLQEYRTRVGEREGWRAQGAIHELARLVRQLELGGGADLTEVLAQLRDLPAQVAVGEPPAPGDSDQVTISTIHGAKGLEWPVVLLADSRAYHDSGQPLVIWDAAEGAVICTSPDGQSLAYATWRQGAQGSVAREEHRRLVYVAMTRARDLLMVSGRLPSKGSSELSGLLEAAEGDPAWAVGVIPEPGGLHPWFGAGALAPEPAPAKSAGVAQSLPQPGLSQRWAQLEALARERSPELPERLSFSALKTLAECPRQFWFRHLRGFPEADEVSLGVDGTRRDQALALGRVVHGVLEAAHRQHPERAPSPQELESELVARGGELQPPALARARGMVAGYASSAAATLPTVAVECTFRWEGWAGADAPALEGAIDRVARGPSGELLVLDYKTNATLPEAERASYARQLQLYSGALAAGALGAPVTAISGRVLWLEAGQELDVDCGSEARELALSWAREGAERVRRGDYRSVESFPDRPCRSCPFAAQCPERRSDWRSAPFGHPEQRG